MNSNTETQAKVYKLIRYAVAEWSTPNMAGGYSSDGAKLLKEIGCEWGWKGTIFTIPATHEQHTLLNRALKAVDAAMLNRSQLGIVSNRKLTLTQISKGNYCLLDNETGYSTMI